MKTFRVPRMLRLVPAQLLVSLPLTAQEIPMTNWTVPPYRAADTSGGYSTMVDISPGVGFVAMQPCRIVDTRGGGVFTGAYGPPIMAAAATRTFDLNSSPHCTGIPAGVEAYSLNFTVTQTQGPVGDIRAWPTGSPPVQLTSVLNWTVTGATLANAIIVPAGTNGAIDVQVAGSSTHLLIDINGYFTDEYSVGVQFLAAGRFDSAAAILGVNQSTANGSHGVGGFASGAGIVHGVQGEIGANALSDSSGVHGISNSNSSAASGVFGEARTNTGAGVRGSDAPTSIGASWGVMAEGHSGNLNSAAVYAFAFQATGNAGIFVNSQVATTYIGTQISNVGYSLFTDGRIRGGALDIVGSPKNFVSPHPEDAGLEIRYASVEAPTVDVYFRGTAELTNGLARIEVPDHFRFTARDGTYMTTLTPVGRAVPLSVVEEGPRGILVHGAGNARFHYVVWAERDEIVGYEPVVRNTTFTPEALERTGGADRLPESTRSLLMTNGTLNPDGTYNMETARSRGWVIPERQPPISP